MSKKKHFTHLTEDERYSIEECIEHGRSKVYMAELIGKDKSTIAREIKCHRKRTYECPLPIECAALPTELHQHRQVAVATDKTYYSV